MVLWSIQPLEEWDRLQTTKVLRGAEQFVWPEFLPAYQWLRQQMRQRICRPPDEATYPMWAWYQWRDSRRRKPDFRWIRHHELRPGSSVVRLELEVDASRVLLSDFVLWHCAINNWYLSSSRKDDLAFERERAARGFSSPLFPLPPDLQRRVTESWERIFDLDWYNRNWTNKLEDKTIQATLWEIRLDDVRRVDVCASGTAQARHAQTEQYCLS